MPQFLRVRAEIEGSGLDSFGGRLVGDHQVSRRRFEQHLPRKRELRDGAEVQDSEQVDVQLDASLLDLVPNATDNLHAREIRGMQAVETAVQRLIDGLSRIGGECYGRDFVEEVGR